MQFHRLCQAHIRPGSRILEIGAGPSNRLNLTSPYLATLGAVVGIDTSDEVLQNAHLKEAYVYGGQTFPFGAEAFDACVSNFVLEHVQAPAQHFQEVARVLRPGGTYCFRTPNLWHYVGLASRVLPYGLHRRYAHRLRGLHVGDHEPYPVFYQANTRGAIARWCQCSGLRVAELHLVEKEPSYGRSHEGLFWLMMLYERIVNSSPLFWAVRANILAAASKPGAPRAEPPAS